MISKRSFSSLDRQLNLECSYSEPDRYRDLFAACSNGNVIARGAAISYVGLAFGKDSTSIGLKSFDRILDFDPIKQVIRVEAGISLGKLDSFLEPHRLYLSVQPGYPQITIGGCVACNIHGKNQFKEGVFSSVVLSLTLFHPKYGLVEISRETEPELFELTCGGFGLTGLIVNVTLKLRPKPGDTINVHNVRVGSLKDTYQKLLALKDQSDLLYSWNDLCPFGRSQGAGFVTTGTFSSNAGSKRVQPSSFKKIDASRRIYPRFFNRFTVPTVNWLYFISNTVLRPKREISFQEFNYPVLKKTFYFELFGQNGFIERQMLIPFDSCEAYLSAFESLIGRFAPPVALCSCKIFQGRQSHLNYAGSGLSLSIDLPARGYDDLHRALDQINIEHKVLDNITKDSRLELDTVRAEYNEYDKFRTALRRHDPKRVFRSALSERLGL